MSWISNLFGGGSKKEQNMNIWLAQQQATQAAQAQQAQAEAAAQQQAQAAAAQQAQAENLAAMQRQAQADREAAQSRFDTQLAETRRLSAQDNERANAQLAQQRAEAESNLSLLRSQLEGANKAYEEMLAKSAEQAAEAQRQSEQAAYRASLTPADSEDARRAGENRQRKLLSAKGFLSTIAQTAQGLGAAPVATRQLLGA